MKKQQTFSLCNCEEGKPIHVGFAITTQTTKVMVIEHDKYLVKDGKGIRV